MRSLLPALASLVVAHVADEIVVSLDGNVETITMTAQTLSLLAPVDVSSDGELTQDEPDARADAVRLGVWEQAKLEPCTRSDERAAIEPGYVRLTAKMACPAGAELSQEFKWLQVLPPNYRVVMGNQVARGELRTLHMGGGKTTRLLSVDVVDLACLGLVALAGLAAAIAKKFRSYAIATAIFVLGFWLVHRLMT